MVRLPPRLSGFSFIIMVYFELHEFIKSETARKLGIDNIPSFERVSHLHELVEYFLDPLRSAYGKPITVTSGYRCPELNRAVKGSATSAHLNGYAADLQVAGDFDNFCQFVAKWVKSAGKRFDQILIENDTRGTRWLHVGLYNNAGQQRGQIKILSV